MSPANPGSGHHASKISEEKLLAIKKYLDIGISQSEIARMMNVSQPTVSRISRGLTYVDQLEESGDSSDGNTESAY